MEKPVGFDAVAAALAGHRVPGGCESCDAYQTAESDPNVSGVIHLWVHHDDWCPALAREQGRA